MPPTPPDRPRVVPPRGQASAQSPTRPSTSSSSPSPSPSTSPVGSPSSGTPVAWAGLWLGLGFGGFFDGILLHQVLQWHHLLSAVAGPWAADLGHQILADGLFHAVMFVLAGLGLAKAVRHRAGLAAPDGARRFAAAWVVGFGVWHVLDAVGSHWLLGLHRVRMDTAHPLAWDLGWVAVFGLVPIVVGLRMWRGTGAGTGTATNAARWPLALVVGTVLGGAVANLPPPDGSAQVVVLADAASSGAVFRALAQSDARVVAGAPGGRVWWVAGAGLAESVALYRHGALYVGGGLTPAGCSAWTRPTP